MVKRLKEIHKEKERKVFNYEKLEDLDAFCFSKEIPKNSMHVEIRVDNSKKLLIIDYIINLKIKSVKEE